MTLEEVRSVSPERPVSDAEMDDALRSCLQAMKKARPVFRDGKVRFAPEWDDELRRIMETYAPYFAARVLRSELLLV